MNCYFFPSLILLTPYAIFFNAFRKVLIVTLCVCFVYHQQKTVLMQHPSKTPTPPRPQSQPSPVLVPGPHGPMPFIMANVPQGTMVSQVNQKMQYVKKSKSQYQLGDKWHFTLQSITQSLTDLLLRQYALDNHVWVGITR